MKADAHKQVQYLRHGMEQYLAITNDNTIDRRVENQFR